MSNKSPANRFGEYIRQRRKAQNLSQEKLAEETGLDADTIGRLERGENLPTFETIRVLAAQFSVEVEVLARLAHVADSVAPGASPSPIAPTPGPRESPGLVRPPVPLAGSHEPTPNVSRTVEIVVYNYDDALAWRGTGTPDTLFRDLLTWIRNQEREIDLPVRDHHYWFVADCDPSERLWRLEETLGECMANHGNPARLKFNLRWHPRIRRG